MKEIIKIIVIVTALILPSCTSQTVSQVDEPQGEVSLQFFYAQLNPYGVWMNYPPYGRVWIPDVGRGFSPYATSGNWVFTSWGWTWQSYYSWGWAPFHYGRWFYDAMFGWVWIPDTTWGPAWVVWSTGGGYCGWAPLGPNVSVSVALSGRYTIPRDHWVFVREDDLTKSRITRYRVEQSRNSELLNNSVLVRETREHRQSTYTPGPKNRAAQRSMDEFKQNEIRRNDRGIEEQPSRNSTKSYKREMPSENSSSREKASPRPRSERQELRPQNRWENSRKQDRPNARPGRESVDRRQPSGRGKKGG